jgi:hypothetical protein
VRATSCQMTDRKRECSERERDAHAHPHTSRHHARCGRPPIHARPGARQWQRTPVACIHALSLLHVRLARDGCDDRVTSHPIWSHLLHSGRLCMAIECAPLPLHPCNFMALQWSVAWASLTIRVGGHAHATRTRISLSWPAGICRTVVYFELLQTARACCQAHPCRPEGETQFKQCVRAL